MPGEEVICLSSDEEESSEDLPRKNLVDCDSSPSKLQAPIETIKRENSEGKRKLSVEDQSPRERIPLKKVKVDLTGIWLDTTKKSTDDVKNTKESSGASTSTDKIDNTSIPSTSGTQKRPRLSTESSTSGTSEGNSHRIKPSLVIRTKEPVNIENKQEGVFSMFISQCLSRERSKDMQKVVEKLKRKYEQLDASYANSDAFVDLLNEKRNLLILEEGSLYMHIKDVLDEMKFRKASKINKVEPEVTDADVDEVEAAKQFRRQEAQVKKLEKTMELVQKRIKKYEEAEVDWDDEDDSMYMKLERYKRRMVELYNMWCKLTDSNEDAGRPYLRPKHIRLTGITNVDAAINSFVNTRLKKRSSLSNTNGKDEFFPDYFDILDLIKTYNEQMNLGFTKYSIQTTAKKAFEKLGEFLKKERQQDYYDTFSMWNFTDDPAQNDPELLTKLEENREQGDKKLNEIFEEYTKKQEEINANGKGTEANDENEEDNDEDEEDEEDEGDDERDVSDSEIVDMESDSNAAEDPDDNKENGVKNTENGAVRIDDKKMDVDKELEIVETAEISKTSEKKELEENLSNAQKQETPLASTSTIKNSDELNDKSKVNNIDNDDNHDDDDDEADSKPVLKLRSFAKPPCFWANSQEIKDSDLTDKPSIRNKNNKDKSIEIIDLDMSDENSPVKKVQHVQNLPGGKTIKRIMPVSVTNVCRLSAGDSISVKPMASSTPNPTRVSNNRIAGPNFPIRPPMASSTPNPTRVPNNRIAGPNFPMRPQTASSTPIQSRVNTQAGSSNFRPRFPITTQRPNQSRVVNAQVGSSNPPSRLPIANSVPARQVQFSRTASNQVESVRHHNNYNVNNLQNLAARLNNCATSNSASNGRKVITVTSTETGKTYVNVNSIRLTNPNSNNINSNYNINGPGNRQINSSNNNNNNNINTGPSRVLNPMAAPKNVQRSINKTNNNFNRPPRSNGHMS